MIEITVNGSLHQLNTGTTVEQMVTQLDLKARRMAIEINQEIVPRSDYSNRRLIPGDVVEIVQAIGGG